MPRKSKETIEAEKLMKAPVKRKNSNPNYDKNLHKFTKEQDRELAKKNGSLGGAVRKKNNERRMKLRELSQAFLDLDSPYDLKKSISKLGIDDDEITNLVSVVGVIFNKAITKGDVAAAKTIMEWAGYDPATVLREMQFEYTKENGQNINVNLEGNLETKSRVQIYLPQLDDVIED